MLPNRAGVKTTATNPAPIRKSINRLASADPQPTRTVGQRRAFSRFHCEKEPTPHAQKCAMSPRWEVDGSLAAGRRHFCAGLGWVGEGYRKSAQKLEEVAHRAQRKHFSIERAANWLSDPGIDLCLVVGFLLRQSSDDSRAGHHGHKCESDQNVVHARTPQQRNPDPGPVPLKIHPRN
jgi:hypothetical protein